MGLEKLLGVLVVRFLFFCRKGRGNWYDRRDLYKKVVLVVFVEVIIRVCCCCCCVSCIRFGVEFLSCFLLFFVRIKVKWCRW